MVLICGHTYCSKCLTKENTEGKTTCPTCRKPHNAKSVAKGFNIEYHSRETTSNFELFSY